MTSTSFAHRLWCTTMVPLNADFSIDESSLRALFRYFAEDDRFRRLGGIILNGEAGEVFYLSRAEQRRVVEIAFEEINGRLPIVSGAFAMSTAELVEATRDMKAMGVAGIFAMPPAGAGEVTRTWDPVRYPEVWIDQLKAQDKAVNLPIIVHPSAPSSMAYGGGLPAPAAVKMCEAIPNIVGWKMNYTYDGYLRVMRELRRMNRHVAILPASARYFHEMLALGEFDGTSAGCWNYGLEATLDHYDAWQRKDIDTARELWARGLGELHGYIGQAGRIHIRYKVAAWLRGLLPNYGMRPPMPAPEQAEITDIRAMMQRVGIEVVR